MWGFCGLKPTGAKTHLIKAFRWSANAGADWVAIVSAAIGMAAPVVLGTAFGDLPADLAASVAGMLVGGVRTGSSLRAQLGALARVLAPAPAAAVLVAGYG
jgi:hypothetical protein